MQVNLTNTIISTLGNPTSLVPLAAKDCFNSLGLTYASYKAGGELEGKDRLIDEFGTQAIWLGGLPLFKLIANNTVYKFAKLSPQVDIRVVDSKEHLSFAKKICDDKNVLKSIEDATTKFPLFKKLFYSKVGTATILTFISYYALTKYKQKHTEKAIEKAYMKRKANEKFLAQNSQEQAKSDSFSALNKLAFKGIIPQNASSKGNKPSFKGLNFQSFMFDPVKNLMLVDGCITTQRLGESRTKLEFAEYSIKEGSIIFFLYFAGKCVQAGIEKLSEKLFKRPIDMDLRFLNSKQLKDAIKSGKVQKDLDKFAKAEGTEGILNYIANNQSSTIVEGAKASDIIRTFKKSSKIDPGGYIDKSELKGLAAKLTKFIDFQKASKMNVDDFVKGTRNNKIASIFANMAVCCFALGYVMPKAMIEFRQKHSGTKEFHVAKEYEKKLSLKFSGNQQNNA